MAKTPAGHPLAVASKRIATAMAAEWAAQGERLDPATMPLTRIVNSAIDGVSRQVDAVRADIVRHAGSDLVCYRAEGPEALTARQEAVWAPLLAFARDALGARFVLAEGVMHVEQSPEALAAIGRALQGYDAPSLAAIHTVTTLTGSAVIALALARHQVSAEEGWAAAHVDEDWQMSQWGEDAPALQRRALRWREMEAAAAILAAA
jgi:chaperone required for assembly of F1-ATPase